jgi:hypothetical protein
MWLHYTAPPLSKAQVVQPPAEINVALLIPATVTGVMLSVVGPLPSYGQRYDQIDASVNFTQFRVFSNSGMSLKGPEFR